MSGPSFVKKPVTYYLTGVFAVNLFLTFAAARFNPVIIKNWSGAGSSLPVLSLWVVRMQTVFPVLSALSLVLMLLYALGRLQERVVTAAVYVILMADVAVLIVCAFGYPLPFISFEPRIE